MKNAKLPQFNYAIYPGQFVPLLNEVEVKKEVKKFTAGNRQMYPAVTVTDLGDCVKVEVAVPGVKREDFVLYTDKNFLTVCVLHKESDFEQQKKEGLPEFNNVFFYKHIKLPLNVDTAFISAEYNGGILRLHIPKSDFPAARQHTRIVVY
jgi:HSP20 family protein